MAYRNSPRVVTNGLVFYVDAANQNSYPSGSVRLFDLAGSPYTGSVTSSFSSSYLFFNGSSNIINYNQTDIASNNFTINLWCRPSSTISVVGESNTGISGIGGQGYVFGPMQHGSDSGAGVSVGTNVINVYEHGASYLPALLVYQSTITNFTNICVVYTNKTPSLYLNGVLVRTGLTSTKTTVFCTLDTFGQETTYGFFSGSIASVACYSRSLSVSEIVTNYNALKGRFGIS